MINKAGGNAGKSSKGYRLSLPTVWMKEMGITEEDRDLELFYDGTEIIIKKKEADHGRGK
jgi:hypothetical protein